MPMTVGRCTLLAVYRSLISPEIWSVESREMKSDTWLSRICRLCRSR